mgnify:CR=1 FL=1
MVDKMLRNQFDAIFPEIENQCLDLFISSKYVDLLNLIQSTILNTFRSNIYHNKALFVNKFDDILINLGFQLENEMSAFKSWNPNNLNIIIGTEYYAVGGHTRVAQEFSKIEENTLIVITDAYGRTSHDVNYYRFFQDLFENNSVILLPPGNLLEKIIFLKKLINCMKPKTAVLLTHHDDPIGVTALCGSAINKKIFHHHCDHNISLGATIKEFYHYDTTPFGKAICSNKTNAKYLPLSYSNNYYESPHLVLAENFNSICAASSVKFNLTVPSRNDFYPKIVGYILNTTSGCHYHIGVLTEEELVKIKIYLSSLGIKSDRFIYLGQVKSLVEIIHNIKNPVYFVSFPTPGILAWIEVMSTGIPVFVFSNTTGELSNEGLITDKSFDSLIAENAFKFTDQDSIKEYFGIVKENYVEIINRNKKYFNENHSTTAVEQIMKQIII